MTKFLPPILLMLIPVFLQSQSPCPDPITPAINDVDPGCTICEFPITGTSVGYTPGPLTNGDYGCGNIFIDNEQYIAFIAGSGGCVTFTIDAWNCTGGVGNSTGLQAMIFDLSLTTAYDCIFGNAPAPNPPPFTSNTCGLTPGQAYLLVIDGYNGALCDFTIDATGTQGGDFVTISPSPLTACASDPPFTFDPYPPLNSSNGTGTWTGDVDADGTFDPAALGPGTYSATYTFDNTWGCSDDETVTFTILPGASVTIDPAGPFCEDDPSVNLNATPAGGDWGGPVSPTGVFNPTSAGSGFHVITYTYTDPGGCVVVESITIEVVEKPIIVFLSPDEYCVNEDPVVLEADPSGGTWGGAASPSGEIDPSALGVGTHTVTYTYSEPTAGCTEMLTQQITILPQPMLTFSNTGPFCENGGIVNITANPPGGDWGGAADFGGEVDPEILGPGFHDVTYEYTDGNGCTADSVFQIQILEAAVAEINPIDDLCHYDSLVQMTATPTGGTWSGAANAAGVINPQALGGGFHTVIYTVVNPNGCNSVAEYDVEINDELEILFFNTGPFCLENQVHFLDSDPLGGDWGGDVDVSGDFNPIDLGIGTFTANYTYFYGTDCVTTDSVDFQILASGGVAFTDSIFCKNSGLVTVPVNPTGGVWSGSNITPTGQINTDTLGLGTFTATYTFGQGTSCTSTRNLEIEIQDFPSEITGDTIFCQTADTIQLIGTPAGGTWSGVADNLGRVNPRALTIGSHSVFYTTTSPTGCIKTVNQIVNVTPPPTATLSGAGTLCPGGNATTDLLITLTDTASWMVNYLLDSIPQTPIQADSSPFVFRVNQAGTYILTGVADTFGCSNIASGMATVTEIIPLTITNINSQCNATNTGFTMTFEISGGNPASYAVTGVSGTISANAPFIFTSQIIPSNSTANFEVSDNSGCAPVSGSLTVDCSCQTQVGNMDLTPLHLCGSAPAIYDNSSENLEPDDLVQFILHTGSGVVLGTVLSTNNAPEFDFIAGSMMYETTYYISAVAGNDDGTGNVDLSDNCLSVAQGTPVTWYEAPTAELLDSPFVCPGEMATMQINLTGVSPWDIRYSDGTNTFDLTGITTNPFDLIVSPTVTTTYELVSISDDICDGSVTGRQTVTIFDSPSITTPTINCDPTGTAYSVSFEISGGDAGSYMVFGLTGNIVGNTFTSDLIPSGDTFSGSVTDMNDCSPAPFSGSMICQCFTEVGTMDGTPLNICEGDPAIGIYDNSDEFLDPDDALLFYLHTGSSNTLGTILAENTVPEFNFDASRMMYDVTYYISAVAGNQSPTGIDLNDRCLRVSIGTPVTFRALPTVLIAPNQTICEGEEAVLTLEMTGEPPFDVSLSVGGTTVELTGILSGFEYKFNPTTDTRVSILDIRDAFGCENSSSSEATVSVNTPPSATVMNSAEICNTDQSGLPTVFDFSTLITGGDASGTWVDISGAGAVGSFPMLDFDGVTVGQYEFEYTTAIAEAPCVNQKYRTVITVRDCSCPSITTGSAGPFCTDAAELDLRTITTTTEPGSWTISDAPPGSSASILGSNFSGSGSVAGDYELTFTLDDPVNGCPDNSMQIITLIAPPSAIVTPAAEVCNKELLNDLTTFDFSTLITGGDTGGRWEDVDGSNAAGNFPILDFEDILPGDYRFRYTTNSAQAPCTEAIYETILTVRDCSCPSVTTSSAGPFCNDDAIFDLRNMTVTTEQGEWSITNAPSGSTATISGNIFDGNGSAPGDYELTFTLSQMPLPGCDEFSTQVIRISQAVSAGTSPGTLRICNDEMPLDLNEVLQGETPGGTWTDISAVSAGNLFNSGVLTTQNLPNGIYVFQYEVTTDAPCPDDRSTVTVEFDNPVNAGNLIQNLTFCEGLDSMINLFDLIENNDLGGVWSDISTMPTPSFNQNETLPTNNLSGGNYQFEYAVTSGGICPNDEVSVEIRVNETPTADAGEPLELNCDVEMVTIGGSNTSFGPNINYQWSGSNSIENPTSANTVVRNGAIYNLRVSNSRTGCFSEDQVEVTKIGSQPTLNANSIEITCFGDNDGEIRVENVNDGTPPFLYSLNGGAFSDDAVFRNLEPGDYTLVVEDATGCTDQLMFTIDEPEELTVTLTTNLSANSNLIQQGDSIQLQANITGVFDSIQWSPPEAFEPCDPETDPLGCITPWVSPERITTYEVFVMNENGCNDRSSVTVFVEKVRNIYIPSAFSPNDDGINDELQIFTDENVGEIKSFLVFDRWGNTIFEARSFFPDDPAGRWDGRFRGKRMDPAVFVYFAEIEFTDGTTEIFKGDISLLK